MVDARDGGHLRRRPGQKNLVADVDFTPVDTPLDDPQAELFLRQGHHRSTGDAFQDIVGDRRRDQDVVANDEDVLGAAFGEVAVLSRQLYLAGAHGIGLMKAELM
jgi:hypothetical protein